MSVLNLCEVPADAVPAIVANLRPADAVREAAADSQPMAAATRPAGEPAMQCLRRVRRREGYSRRAVARRLGVSLDHVEKHEEPTCDMLLSELYRWRDALGVPVAELLEDPRDDLTPVVNLRCRLLRIMKSARSIAETTREAPVRRMTANLINSLLDIMPELRETTAWPAIGRPRQLDELGEAFFRRLSIDPWDEADGPES